MKRLFIAIDVPEEVRKLASELIAELRQKLPAKGISWTKPENHHITLKFLGDTDEPTEARLATSIPPIAASFSSFKLRLEEAELLGKRVISIAVDSDEPTVFSLEKTIDSECEKLGFEPDGRRFHPHLTLGRIRQSGGTRDFAKHFLQTQVEPLNFEVREIVLYESQLSAGGSIYRKLGTFSLMSQK